LEGGVLMRCALWAAQEMLAVALETERRAYLDAHADVVDHKGGDREWGIGLLGR
jgi:hypothetical protein